MDITMRIKSLVIIIVLVLLTSGCSPNSSRGFSLPQGNPQLGAENFEKYRCTDCHTVAGITVNEDHTYLLVRPVPLGGSSGRITTYGELVTSIINPSHKITRRQPISMTTENGESRMRNINDILTVTELVDLVAFLQPKYKVEPYRTSEYRLYELRTTE